MNAVVPQAASPAISIRLFGAFVLEVRGQPAPPLSRSARAVIALLVLHSDREMERDFIATTLWPDSDEEAARYNLRRTLSEIRGALGPEAERLRTPAGATRTVRFDLSGNAYCDAAAFDAAIAAADDAALGRAITLYDAGGALLEGERSDWIYPEREKRQNAYLDAREHLARQSQARGDLEESLPHLRGVLQIDPMRETAVRSLMLALQATGQSAAALAAYQGLRSRLLRDGVIAPDAETTSLYQRIYQAARQNSAVAASGGTAVRLGAREQSKSSDEARPRRELPRPLTALIGRERDCVEVIAYLSGDKGKPPTRLLTLIGAGGVGKTRLGIAVAAAASPHFEDGVCFVDFAPIVQGGRLASVVVGALRLKEPFGPAATDPMDLIVEAIRSRHLLLLLDNCEHVAADAARLALRLLRECPQLTILATSREALRVPGEVVWRVPSLGEEAAMHLFAERASENSPTFARGTAANVAAVRQIATRLEGIPLAIEMAAARMRALPVVEIAARLDRVFRLLSVPGGDLLPRHQTLRATLDWSYDLLKEPEQILLARLAIFAGGWTRDAADAVCADDDADAPDVLDGLSSLVEKSLVVFQCLEAGEDRYRLLETVRQYALEKLVARGEEAQLRRRHADYYTAFAKTTRNKLFEADQGVWLSRWAAEQDNLRAALGFFVAEPGDAALKMAIAVHSFYHRSGQFAEGRQALEMALRAADAPFLSLARAEALDSAGMLAGQQGDFLVSIAYHSEAIDIFRQLNDEHGTAVALNHLGSTQTNVGALDVADELLRESENKMRALGDQAAVALTLNNRGIIAYQRGDIATARTLIGDGLAIYRTQGDKRRVAQFTGNLGVLASKQKDHAEARRLHAESIAMHRELGDQRGIAYAQYNIGVVHFDEGDYVEARNFWREALAMEWHLRDRYSIYQKLDALGELSQCEGKQSDAVLLWAAAERILLTTGGTPESTDPAERLQTIEAAKSALGDEGFDAVWARGAACSDEEAVLFALTCGD